MHEKQISDGMNDNFSDGEARGLRVIIHMYMYIHVQ